MDLPELRYFFTKSCGTIVPLFALHFTKFMYFERFSESFKEVRIFIYWNVQSHQYEVSMRLAINIDHIATLRNARGGAYPDPTEAAAICESAGASGIVCHLREDRRHIRDADVRSLRESVKGKLDLEMGATDEIVQIALDISPDFVTLVPEHRRELTTEDGLDVHANQHHLEQVIKRFHRHKIPVSLFINPIPEDIDLARALGSDMIEIHTGEYAENRDLRKQRELLGQIQRGATHAKSIGLGVNAGHGIDYTNIAPIAAIPDIDELSIGYAVIARSLFVGLENAVREMLALVQR
jgi:pyridoxine 5-phosphate synthase